MGTIGVVLAVMVGVILAAIVFFNMVAGWDNVLEYEVGLFYQNGRFIKVAGPGSHLLIHLFLRQSMVKVDTRLISATVPAQEILTKDQLPLRLTVIAQYRVVDATSAVHKAKDFTNLLYEEIQLAMRELVAGTNLDELLEKKALLSQELAGKVRPKMAEFGIEVATCGLKDIVLPGDIKSLLIKTAEAARESQAKLICAREELAATRCQMNTAKLIVENPAILRLKELQTLAEVAKKPGNTILLASPMEISAKTKGA